jgi:hypothetical protein
MTEGPLQKGNREALQVLCSNPHLLDRYPRLVALKKHLEFWLNKYDRVFLKHPEMCVLYTGEEEDGVGYPRGLHAEMEAALNESSHNQVSGRGDR